MVKELAFCICLELGSAQAMSPGVNVVMMESQETPLTQVVSEQRQVATFVLEKPETVKTLIDTKQESIVLQVPETEVVFKVSDTKLSDELQQHVYDTCIMYDVDPFTIIAQIEKESSCRAYVCNPRTGCAGLMQIYEKWHVDRMERLGVTDLLDGKQNILVGIDYMAELLKRCDGDYIHALMCYNMGGGNADPKFKNGEYSDYAIDIVTRAEQLRTKTE